MNSNLDDSGISLPVFPYRTNLKLHNISVTPKMVKTVLMNIDLSKASAPDCIPVVVLKNCVPKLSYILVKLFNKCLKESYFPVCWKISLVFPAFENVGDRFTAELLIIQRSVVFFSDFHYGFKSFRSTVDLAFNSSETTRAVALDISKAFNMVWHAGLLHKLKSYEISGQIFGIISFLYNRRLWEEYWVYAGAP